MNQLPGAELLEPMIAAAGKAPTSWTRVFGGGYTAAERWLVGFDDGSRAFAKFGTTELVAGWIRVEQRVYSEIQGSFMPRLLGWSDGPVPVLLIEDLSAAEWPPPWRPGMVDRIQATLDEVAATTPPEWVPAAEAMTDIFSGWARIASDPEPFLGLGLVSRDWLDGALPRLMAVERPPELGGTALLHLDVRSDNMCFTPDRALLVDWNHAARGNPLFDIAAWLPSLAFEGGPMPEAVSAEAGVFAGALAGYLCARAPMPRIPDAPHVRRAQFEQATVALPWAARWLGLPEPDGPRLARPA
jgi:hypothetical protein